MSFRRSSVREGIGTRTILPSFVGFRPRSEVRMALSMIVISPWDPSAVPLIDKAIRTSDLGLNPTNDGKIVRVPIPSLTEERRKDMVKHLHKVLENHRTAVRNIRR